MADYTKLSNLVDDTFLVERVSEYQWKMWDNEQRKMLISDNYQQGYRKMYTLDTDKGLLDVSASQLGTILEAVSYKGEAQLIGKTISVKSNGKTGMDIRYYFNVAKSRPFDNEDDLPYGDEGGL